LKGLARTRRPWRKWDNAPSQKAKALGVPAYYVDPTLGACIIKELPDGTRQRVERIEGKEIVLETLGPSA
jgi:hypothetical protein